MERMWRKVNHSFTGRTSKSTATIQSTDTTSSAGFGEGQIVVAVANNNNNNNNSNCNSTAAGGGGTGNLPSSTATGRRLAASGVQSQTVITPNQQKSLSQHVLLNSTASSERRRRRRRKSRPRRSGDMTSGGFGHQQIMESTNQQHKHHHQQQQQIYQSHDQEPPLPPPLPPPPLPSQSQSHLQPQQQQQQQQSTTSSSALMMGVSTSGNSECYPPIVAPTIQQQDVSLRQRAVAKLRMFNFHLNWDLHMTQCKPCGPRSGGGNIITRRLCRNRRREDNELYRSNSFKFERFERKECNEEFADTLQKKFSQCSTSSCEMSTSDWVKKNSLLSSPTNRESISKASGSSSDIIPVKEILSLSFAGKNILEQANTNKFLNQRQQKQLVRIIIQFYKLQNKPLNRQEFEKIAKDIESTFHREDKSTYFVAPNAKYSHPTGMLYNAYHNFNRGKPKDIQKYQNQQKENTSPSSFQVQVDEQEYQDCKQYLKFNDRPWVAIEEKWEKTSKNRLNEIREGRNKNSLEVLREWPLYKHADAFSLISICDDYSLPIDFVKKRPSSFDPCLAEAIPNPETWVAPSPLSDLVNFIEPPSAAVGGASETVAAVATAALPPPPPQPPTSSASAGNVNTTTSTKTHHLQSHQPSQHRSHHHPPLPNTIKKASVKLIEGYSDPKDTKRPKKVYHKKSKPRKENKRSNYSSDSSAPKSSADEDTNSVKAPELNSPDSISEDLVRPLPPLHRSPRKLTTLSSDATANSKRNPSPYYYSDLLKTKETDKDTKQKSRQSTASEPPQLTQQPVITGSYRKSTSLDVPEVNHERTEGTSAENPEQQHTPKRYSFTEEGVRIIRCTTPSTSTSDDSDCSECQKRREWHARALALVRQTCNIQSVSGLIIGGDQLEQLQLQPNQFIPLESELQSMPPHRLLGPAVCACAAPTIGDDLDEYFRPRSIFYVHPQGVHECADCSASTHSVDNLNEVPEINAEQEEDDGEMSGGRTRQFYETAFDCKITKSDDDLDEVDRITNHSVLLQLDNGNSVPPAAAAKAKPLSDRKTSRLEGKRLKNSKNQAIQDKTNASATAAASGTINSANSSSTVGSGGAIAGSVSALSNDLENVHIDHNTSVDQMNNTTSSSQLPMRGYTPSPPSTAPLPMKFPSKHDRFFMNSIKSAPNLPSSNPAAHPRLKDLRLPIQSHHRAAIHAATSIDSQNSSFAEKSRTRPERPRSFVLESGRVLELRKSGGVGGSSGGHHHHAGHAQASSNNSSPANGRRHQHNYSSTESIATSSSGGSMESLRSSTSEGNRSTSSSGSRHSTSLSSHSSESGSSLAFPLRAPIVIHSKLHILSPISDKSSQEPASDASEFQKNASPEDQKAENNQQSVPEVMLKKQRRPPPNKTLLHLADEILGSDSGISLHSRGEDGKKSGLHKFTLPKLNFPSSEKTDSGIGPISGLGLPQDLRDLPFDMPKLRRRKTLQQDTCTSGSATSVDLGDLPFDMPKLRRRLRMNQADMTNLLVHSTESSGISQASSSHSMRDENKTSKLADTAIFRQNLTLNLNEPARSTTKFGSLDLRGIPSNKELNLNLITGFTSAVDLIDISVPLERQGWYHGAITRIEAETTLRPLSEGSFLVRNCESTKQDYSLSLKGAKGFMHMRIQRNDSGQYILGQFSRPFDSVPEMIRHFCLNRLPVRGAEHMCLIDPVIAQLL